MDHALTRVFTLEVTVELNPAEYIPSTPANRFRGHNVEQDVWDALQRNLVAEDGDGQRRGVTIMTESHMSEYGEVTGLRLFDLHHKRIGEVKPDGKWLARRYGVTS